MVRFVYEEANLPLIIIGCIVGILIGLFLGRTAFQAVDSLLEIDGQMSGKESYNLFGSRFYQWLIASWIVFLNVEVFFAMDQNILFGVLPIVAGLYYGGVLSYFILFAVKAFIKERILNNRIIITCE